jgi:hypothetical protein
MPEHVPGWEGRTGPFPAQYGAPHVYARDVYSGAGNCVCGSALDVPKHVQAAPGVPIPGRPVVTVAFAATGGNAQPTAVTTRAGWPRG